MVKRRKRGLVCALPWHTKSIFVKCDQPPEKPYSAPFCSPFAGQKKLLINCDSVMEKAKYGKMRQVNAVNGSQMVVKIEGFLLPLKETKPKPVSRTIPVNIDNEDRK